MFALLHSIRTDRRAIFTLHGRRERSRRERGAWILIYQLEHIKLGWFIASRGRERRHKTALGRFLFSLSFLIDVNWYRICRNIEFKPRPTIYDIIIWKCRISFATLSLQLYRFNDHLFDIVAHLRGLNHEIKFSAVTLWRKNIYGGYVGTYVSAHECITYIRMWLCEIKIYT